MVMGPDAGKEWIQLQGDKVDALFITAGEGDGFDHWATPDWPRRWNGWARIDLSPVHWKSCLVVNNLRCAMIFM